MQFSKYLYTYNTSVYIYIYIYLMYKKTYNSIGQITLDYYSAATDSFIASPSHSPLITLTLASSVIICIARVRHWNEYSLRNNNIALYSGQKSSTLSNYLSELFAGGEHYLLFAFLPFLVLSFVPGPKTKRYYSFRETRWCVVAKKKQIKNHEFGGISSDALNCYFMISQK